MSDDLRLAPPAARQGPGPVPRAAIDRVALSLARRAAGVLTGETRARGLADGTELEQVRPYRDGDDVRRLDPAAGARTGVPHVRMYVPERNLTTWIVLDVSPSMAWGTAQRLKSDVALGAVHVVSELAIRHSGLVGLVLCGGAKPFVLAPRGGRPAAVAVQRAAARGTVPDGEGRPGALADGLRAVHAVARRPGLVAVVSDLPADEDLRKPLAALGRHAVLAVEVRDPHELALPPVRHLALVDPETGEHVEVSLDEGVRARYAEQVGRERDEARVLLARLGAVHAVVDTAHPWLPTLAARLRRGPVVPRARA